MLSSLNELGTLQVAYIKHIVKASLIFHQRNITKSPYSWPIGLYHVDALNGAQTVPRGYVRRKGGMYVVVDGITLVVESSCQIP